MPDGVKIISAVIRAIDAGHWVGPKSCCRECLETWPCSMILAARREDSDRGFSLPPMKDGPRMFGVPKGK